MPRILYIGTGTNRGGAEIQTLQLATEMKARGWQVRMVGMIPPGPIAAGFEAAGIECRTLNMRRGAPSLAAIRRLRQEVREFRPDVIHSHMVHANILARIAVGGGKRWPPLICTVHNIDEGGHWRPLAYRLTDHRAWRTTHVSALGLAAQRQAGLLSKERSLFIPNAVRFDSREPGRGPRENDGGVGTQAAFTWLYVGRLDPVKRVPFLVGCFRRVLDAFPDSRLILVGGGSDAAMIRAMCGASPLKESVDIVGPQDDVQSWLRRADGFVTLAHHEGMPLTILEAGMHSLPVVATDVGGVAEMIADDSQGWLVDQTEAGAVNAMLEVMRLSPGARAKFGDSLQQHIAATFSVNHIMPQWLALYQEAMAVSA